VIWSMINQRPKRYRCYFASVGSGMGHGMNALSAYRGERFAQGVEDVVGTDHVGKAVAVQIGPQRRFGMYEHQRYTAADQFLLQVPRNARRRIIDPGDRAPASNTSQFTVAAPSTRSRMSAATSSKGRLIFDHPHSVRTSESLGCLGSFSISRAREGHSPVSSWPLYWYRDPRLRRHDPANAGNARSCEYSNAFQTLTTNADMAERARRRCGTANALVKRRSLPQVDGIKGGTR
jgi:hypothetical protein